MTNRPTTFFTVALLGILYSGSLRVHACFAQDTPVQPVPGAESQQRTPFPDQVPDSMETARKERAKPAISNEPDKPKNAEQLKKLKNEIDRQFIRLSEAFSGQNMPAGPLADDAQNFFSGIPLPAVDGPGANRAGSVKEVYHAFISGFPATDEAIEKDTVRIERELIRMKAMLDVAEGFVKEAHERLKPPSNKDPQKAREKAIKQLQQIVSGDARRNKPGKWETANKLRLEKETHYDIRDGEELFAKAKALLAELQLKTENADPTVLLADWHIQRKRLELFMDGAKRLFESAPMKTGVTKKGIQAELDALDKAMGCFEFRLNGAMYDVCKSRKGPPPPNMRTELPAQPFSHQKININDVPQECVQNGQATIKQGPTWKSWVYCDNLNAGCMQYVFVEDFFGLGDLQMRDQISYEDLVRAFRQACRGLPATQGYKLVYAGPSRFMIDEMPNLAWRNNQEPPAGTFGMEGMDRIARAMAPPLPFAVEIMLDPSLFDISAEINQAVVEFEKFDHALLAYDPKLQLVLGNEFKSGIAAGKSNYEASRDALNKTRNTAGKKHPLYGQATSIQARLDMIVGVFDARTNEIIRILRQGRTAEKTESRYYPGDKLYLFAWISGSPLPKMRFTFTVTQLLKDAEGNISEQSIDPPITRIFDDVSDPQRLITTAIEGQKYFLAWYRYPLIFWNFETFVFPGYSSPGYTPYRFGVDRNQFIISQYPGDYRMRISATDESTKKTVEKEIFFSVVP